MTKKDPTLPVTWGEFERYKKFISMQAASLFLEIEIMKDKMRSIESIKPIPKARRDSLDIMVRKMSDKINFLEKSLIKHGNSSDKN